jgi:uncharacterized YigZ family protein
MYQIAQTVSAEIEIRKSRFIGTVMRADSRAEARAALEALRRRYPGATHYCWALVCGNESAFDDDGEPAGTAARPIYNVLSYRRLDRAFAVVVRYFGGIKLGAGGLARAYGQAVGAALRDAQLVPVEAMTTRVYACAFAAEATLRRLFGQFGATVTGADYATGVTLQVRMRVADAAALEAAARDALKGALDIGDARPA